MLSALTAGWRRAARVLDRVYLAAGVTAAAFLVLLLAAVALQVTARWAGVGFPGSTNYAGYCMAASSFLALAFALSRGAHIRVHFMLNALGSRRAIGEAWCYLVAAPLATWFAWFALRGNYFSRALNDISQGQDATPLWIPQLAMSAGAVLVAVALWDGLLRVLLFGPAPPSSARQPSPSTLQPSLSTPQPSPSTAKPPPPK
ncbi:MAG: TRAP transporter small permease [Gammaproteobacteria bacterium]|nr:TRAP transporter small permease [Gammaproteobacteria bacterium]MDD9798913.1 TRAP transporter small permease [Gammaproteobacteria bacterium]MDD9815668.1 TRAP transporter small permease [Gammaproteobacteria bacterium]MDD9851604.1 TRAP transporter small permease [Gammaproteobacteria bacterium]MDD9871574.1 TRAP transporter small permease [Gammaproteobacteria bacterium]